MFKLKQHKIDREKMMLRISYKYHKRTTWMSKHKKLQTQSKQYKKFKQNWAGHLARIEDVFCTTKNTKWTQIIKVIEEKKVR